MNNTTAWKRNLIHISGIRNYIKVTQHFNDKVYIQAHMIAQAKCTQGGAT